MQAVLAMHFGTVHFNRDAMERPDGERHCGSKFQTGMKRRAGIMHKRAESRTRNRRSRICPAYPKMGRQSGMCQTPEAVSPVLFCVIIPNVWGRAGLPAVHGLCYHFDANP